jgi:hypothetical protein
MSVVYSEYSWVFDNNRFRSQAAKDSNNAYLFALQVA